MDMSNETEKLPACSKRRSSLPAAAATAAAVAVRQRGETLARVSSLPARLLAIPFQTRVSAEDGRS